MRVAGDVRGEGDRGVVRGPAAGALHGLEHALRRVDQTAADCTQSHTA